MRETLLAVNDAGELTCVYDDSVAELAAELGDVRIRRASHVDPVATPAGPRWMADLSPVGGPVLGPFPLRTEALAAELAWLEEHLGSDLERRA
jgi:hypothetical protein